MVKIIGEVDKKVAIFRPLGKSTSVKNKNKKKNYISSASPCQNKKSKSCTMASPALAFVTIFTINPEKIVF